MQDWTSRLSAAGRRVLDEIEPLVSASDRDRPVSARSRLLCAGLCELALTCHEALGGREPERVARAAALLSLLTKVDDEVIDHFTFHGGHEADRPALRSKTRAYLAPTLEAITQPTSGGLGRIALASETGRALRAIGGPTERLSWLLALAARGWEIQEEAVVTLSDLPSRGSDRATSAVTGQISGAWLMMIAAVGTLPASAARGLSPDEVAAFWEWGGIIQRADGLADLSRELDDGLINTVPGRLLYRQLGEEYLRAIERRDHALLYRTLAREQLDLRCLPLESTVRALSERLGRLGELGELLRWIHGMLLSRYLEHPLCARRDLRPLQPFLERELLCSAP